MDRQYSLSVVVPALNEEKNLSEALTRIVAVLNNDCSDWEIILVNDGSTDRTGQIAMEWNKADSRIKVLHHKCPMGIGYSFREGVEVSSKEAVTWLPGDGENEPSELFKYLPLLKQVDIIVPFVINKNVRSRGRQLFSAIYLWLVNLLFATHFSYTNGNIIYRRRIFDVVKQRSTGFIYQTECLIKATRLGFTFIEVPVRIWGRKMGRSKALSWESLSTLAKEFLQLFLEVKCRSKT